MAFPHHIEEMYPMKNRSASQLYYFEMNGKHDDTKPVPGHQTRAKARNEVDSGFHPTTGYRTQVFPAIQERLVVELQQQKQMPGMRYCNRSGPTKRGGAEFS